MPSSKGGGRGSFLIQGSNPRLPPPASPALASRFFTISAIWEDPSRAVGKFSEPQIQREV